MGSEWIETTIGKFCPFHYGKTLPKKERESGQVPVFGSNGIIGKHNKPLVNGPGIIIGRKGTVGSVHFSPVSFWPIDTTFYITNDKSRDIHFTYYLLQTLGFEQMNADSAVPGLNREAAHARRIRIPPLLEQRAIAHILGTLDDKIELNRRMNETLEAMARALFKAWFVDFEPVRAKMEGRWKRGQSLPGLPAHLFDLFPDRLVDSELGEIPEGWEVTTVGDEVRIVKGISYRSEQLTDSDVALVTLKSINRGGAYRVDGLKPYNGDYKLEQVIQPGELILAQTDVTQAAEVIGKPALVLPDDRFKKLVASLDILIIRPRNEYLTREFFYLLFLTYDFQEHVYGHTNGTTVLHLSRIGVPSFSFARPPIHIAQVFSKFAVTIFKLIMNNAIESSTIGALRDALLPKLIGGEIRVKDAVSFLKDHGL